MLEWLQNGLLLIGLGVVSLAYGLYVRRTQDLRGLLMFWVRRLALTRREFLLQRAGIVLMLLGVTVRYLMILQIF